MSSASTLLLKGLSRFAHLPYYSAGFGPDFFNHALSMLEIDPDSLYPVNSKGKRAKTPVIPPEVLPVIDSLYREAMYSPEFVLPVKVKATTYHQTILPTHRWGKTFPVGGVPFAAADVYVIGKWPGFKEFQKGRNLVGFGSELFVRALSQAGFSQDSVLTWYIANTVRFQQPDPNSKAISKGWIDDFAPLIRNEICLIKPRIVLCLGREATKFFTGNELGADFRAVAKMALPRVVEIPVRDGEPIRHEFTLVSCRHPAEVMHNLDLQPDFLSDICFFQKVYSGDKTTVSVSKPLDYRVVYTRKDLDAVIDEVIRDHAGSDKPQPIAIDAEWHGNFWTATDLPLTSLGEKHRSIDPTVHSWEKQAWLRTIQFSHKPGFACTIVLREGGVREPIKGDDRVGCDAFLPSVDAVVPALRRLLGDTEDREVRLVGHNLKADLPWLCKLDQQLGEMLIRKFDVPEGDADVSLEKWKAGHGGFDTMYAYHACREASEKKLEIVAATLCGFPRYDAILAEEKKQFCEKYKIKAGDLKGYGEISDHTMFLMPRAYAPSDADATISVYFALTDPGKLLDCDQFKVSSWRAAWISQAKLTAELEMEMTGMLLDREVVDKLAATYSYHQNRLLRKMQEAVNWLPQFDSTGAPMKGTGFNPNSVFAVRAILFGPTMARKRDRVTGEFVDPRPDQSVVSFFLPPVMSSGENAQPWERIAGTSQEANAAPAANKEVLGIMLQKMRAAGQDHTLAYQFVEDLRAYRFLSRLTSTFLSWDQDVGSDLETATVEVGDEEGVLAFCQPDGRVRTHFGTAETGRVSSYDINMQNWSKRREKDIQEILKEDYTTPLRSCFRSSEGYVYVEADFRGAELFMMASQSGSELMISDCLAADYPEDDPRHVDIHSQVAVKAFQLAGVTPTKKGLKEAKLSNLRDVTKTIVFGLPYGRGDAAIMRGIEQEGYSVSPDQVAAVKQAIFGRYPELPAYLEACRNAVRDPGYIQNAFGRNRRFQYSPDPSRLADFERQASNFPIQSGVGDALSIALRNLRHFPNRVNSKGELRYRLVLQIHDAAQAEVRVEDVPWFIEAVLPYCLSKGVPVYPCRLDGSRIPGRPAYHMPFEWAMFEHWSVPLKAKRALELGIPADFVAANLKN